VTKSILADVDYQETFLEIPDAVPPPKFLELLSSLGTITKSHQWWVGDALVYAEQQYGDGDGSQYADALGLEPHTLTNYRWVAASVTRSRRRVDLSWSHHAEVARLGTDAQRSVLARAKRDGWTVRQLRDYVALTYPQSQPSLFGDDDGSDPDRERRDIETNRRLEEIERTLDAGDSVDAQDVRWLLELAKRAVRS
jgi:hypothetical protein